MSTHILYHANCADGAAACAVVLLVHPAAKTYPVQYGQPVPELPADADVFIVDFSYKRAELEQLNASVQSLFVIDHHASAERELEGLDYCLFDGSESGATLAWKYFFPSEHTPKLLQYIKDRDLWQWDLDHSREFSAGWKMDSIWNKPGVIAAYLDDAILEENVVDFAIKNGTPVLLYQATCIASDIKKARFAVIAGHTVPVLNCTHTNIISEVGGELAKDQPFAATYFDTEDKRIYRRRSAQDEPQALDVSIVAQQYGGGGHKHAAGFFVPLSNPLEDLA